VTSGSSGSQKVIYNEQFVLDNMAKLTSRRVYSFVEAVSFIGGFYYMATMFFTADLQPLATVEFQQEAMNKLIAGQEDKLNMGWGARFLLARKLVCCISKERREHWKACETILHDQLNLVNMAQRINKGKLTLNDKLEVVEMTGLQKDNENDSSKLGLNN